MLRTGDNSGKCVSFTPSYASLVFRTKFETKVELSLQGFVRPSLARHSHKEMENVAIITPPLGVMTTKRVNRKHLRH